MYWQGSLCVMCSHSVDITHVLSQLDNFTGHSHAEAVLFFSLTALPSFLLSPPLLFLPSPPSPHSHSFSSPPLPPPQDNHLDPPVMAHRSSVFAVGTSSTGMPLLPDNPATRPRAPARNEFPRPHLKEEKTRPPLQHRPSLPVLGKAVQRVSGAGQASSVGPSPLVMSRSHSALEGEIQDEEGKDSEEDEEDGGRSGVEPVVATDALMMMECTETASTSPPTTPQVMVTIDDGGNEPTIFPTSESGSGAPPPEGEMREALSAKSSLDSVTNQMRKASLSSLGDLHARKFSTEHTKNYSIFSTFRMPNPHYDIKEYSDCGIDLVGNLGTWDFPIFRFSEECQGHPLSQVCDGYIIYM